MEQDFSEEDDVMKFDENGNVEEEENEEEEKTVVQDITLNG